MYERTVCSARWGQLQQGALRFATVEGNFLHSRSCTCTLQLMQGHWAHLHEAMAELQQPAILVVKRPAALGSRLRMQLHRRPSARYQHRLHSGQ
jgi:hypothetical protein